jgi:uncharacterized protein YjiS (DUF1127 family)
MLPVHEKIYGKQEKACFAGEHPQALLESSKSLFHEFWSLSMPTSIMRSARLPFRLHQSNWGENLALGWRVLRRQWARRRQRAALRELADDPHLLTDIGVTRQQALDEAAKPFWRSGTGSLKPLSKEEEQ